MKVCRSTLLALLLMQTVGGQSSSFGAGVLTGSAFDSHHQPVASARITLLGSGTVSFTFETDRTGVYRASVPDGTYLVHAQSAGQGEATAGPVLVAASKTTRLDVILGPPIASQPEFFDEPSFVVAGVTDNTYRGGHGSDTILRSAENLANATASLSKQSPDATNADPHHALGEIEERSGHPVEAAQDFQRAAEFNPTESNLFDWGSELLAHRAPKPAADVFTKGAQLFPRSARMLLGLATAWYSANAYETAARVFFQACDLHPNDPQPYLFLSQVKSREITQLPGYRERLGRFAGLQPDNAVAQYSYAAAVWDGRSGPDDTGARGQATRLLKAALTIDSGLGAAHLELGIIEASAGNYAAAIRSYQQAIQASPNLEEAHYRLSEAYRITGDRTHAAEELALYNRLSRQSAEKLERQRKQILQYVIAMRDSSVTQPVK